MLYAVLDAVVDGYAPVIAGLQHDIDEIETEVFGGDPGVSRRIYELSREVIESSARPGRCWTSWAAWRPASASTAPTRSSSATCATWADHATTAAERVDNFRQLLQNVLVLNATLVSQAQNEEMKQLAEAGHAQNNEIKKISSWAAILFAPTLIGTVYGMNFSHMPELEWVYGYPFAIALMPWSAPASTWSSSAGTGSEPVRRAERMAGWRTPPTCRTVPECPSTDGCPSTTPSRPSWRPCSTGWGEGGALPPSGSWRRGTRCPGRRCGRRCGTC
ncbi:hypothetical protein GCM10020229_60560 [Kitasatospora albolonga]